MPSSAVRRIALNMLERAYAHRNAAEVRLWAARDEVTKQRRYLTDAQAAAALAQRELNRAQEFLDMVWSDARLRADVIR